MPDRIRVLIADDHPIFRSGLRQVLASHSSFDIVDEVADGELAIASLEKLKPDVAVLDIDMPKRDGLEVMKHIRRAKWDVPVIFLTMYDDREMFDEALELGVRGYVLKESASREIVEAITMVAGGKYYVSPSLSEFLIDRNTRAAGLRKELPGLDELTPTEKKVLKLIAEGKTSKEIADEFNMGVRTVDSHRLSISTKLGIHGTHQLVKFAIQNKARL